MDDGDLVISATSSTNGHIVELFRVHKLILSLHSPVFKDMLSIGENSENEKYDGAPRVHLRDDPAEDVAGLIGALYNPTTLPLVRLSPDTPVKVQGIMRLATKYQVDTVRTIIIRHIEADWPTTLAEWERRHLEMRPALLSGPYNRDDDDLSYDYSLFPEPASAIRFAMEFDCPKILPAAFYDLARTKRVVEWETGHLNNNESSRPARWHILQNGDFMRYLKGKERLGRARAHVGTDLRKTAATHCTEGDSVYNSDCHAYVDELLQRVESIVETDPLRALLVMRESKGFSWSDPYWWCCEEVDAHFAAIARELGETLWQGLPVIFELQDLLRRAENSAQ